MKKEKSSLEGLKTTYANRYGHNQVAVGAFDRGLDVVPSGALALDFALGIGGWPRGHISQVFGPKDIGKTTLVGFNSICQAQRLGLTCGYVAVEPNYDPSWAAKNGVNLDQLVVLWPKDGQEAFEMLFDLVIDPKIDWVVFDSIGQVQKPSEVSERGKPMTGGASSLVTWGVQRILNPAWTGNTGVMLINQIRDNMNPNFPGFRPPGGHGLEHSSSIIVQLKPGQFKNITEDGETITIGREVTAVVNRNKLSEGTGRRAKIEYYSMETKDYPFGIDRTKDIVATAKRQGVLKLSGSYYSHDSFPKALQGMDTVEKFFEENPQVVEQIREEVLTIMQQKSRLPRKEPLNGNGA